MLARLVGVFLALVATVTQADSGYRLDQIVARGVLRVGATGDYKPFSYRDPTTGQFLGIDADMAEQLSQALGVRLEFVATSWPNLMKDLADDRFDLAMSGISIDTERQKQAAFSLPYLSDGKTPITRCENLDRFRTLAQIDQSTTRMIVNPGGTNERFGRSQLRRAQIRIFPDNVRIFDQIVIGEADLMITDAIETRVQEKLRPQLCAVHPDAPFDRVEKAYLMQPDLQFKAFVDEWLQQAMISGRLPAAYQKWLAYPWDERADNPPAPGLLASLMRQRLALAVDVARSKWNSQTAIEDLDRERLIIAALARQGAHSGLPMAWVEKFFQTQIDASKLVQRELHERWRKAQLGPLETAPDLAKDLRPKFDELTLRLLAALSVARDELCEPGRLQETVRAAEKVLSLPGLSDHAAKLAASGLAQDNRCNQ